MNYKGTKRVVKEIQISKREAPLLINCKVKTGGATGDADADLMIKACTQPIGCFVRVRQVSIYASF